MSKTTEMVIGVTKMTQAIKAIRNVSEEDVITIIVKGATFTCEPLETSEEFAERICHAIIK